MKIEPNPLKAIITGLENTIIKLNSWLKEHESMLAKSRRETDDARRALKIERGYNPNKKDET